jgi:O-antigen/teichoic acid export membrane protein
MNTARKIAKNAFWLSAADIINKILSMVVMIYIARYLGTTYFGKYSFAIAFVSMFIFLTDLGLSFVLIREVAKDRTQAPKYLGNLTIIKLLLSIFVLTVIYLAINLMNYPPDTIVVVYIIALSSVVGSITGIFRSTIRAFERMEYDAILSVFEKILYVSLAVSILFAGYGVIALALVIAFVSGIGLVASIIITYLKFVKPVFEIDLRFWKKIFKPSISFALAGIFGSLFFSIDTVMLSLMKGDDMAGLYSAAYNLLAALIFIPSIFMNAAFPTFCNLYKSSNESFIAGYEKSFKYLFILTLPIVVGTVILADKFILLIYGTEFQNSIMVLRILMWGFLFLSLTSISGVVLNSMGKEFTSMKAVVISAGLNVLLNLLLIPKYGLIGASLASVIALFLFFILNLYVVSKYLFVLNFFSITVKPLFSCMIMAIFLYYSKSLIDITFLVPLAAIIYFSILLVVKVLSKEDINMLKMIIKKENL